MKRIQKRNVKKLDRRGVTLVEFAIVAPIFFLLLFAMIEFSHLVNIRNAAHNAAYEAARLIVVPGATAQEGRQEARRIMNIVGIRNMSIEVTPSTITPETEVVDVEIQIPYAQNAIVIPRFASGITVKSKVSIKTERYLN